MWKQQSSDPSLLWYDYETWGANPQRDRIAQFAAIRTDMALNPIGEPINLLCKPGVDTLIDPEAVAITGLSPMALQETGLTEWDFAQQIHTHMSLPGTCTVGYNTIRFDDECTRYLFYRNLLDPYAREWKNGNSRWDILDVVRMTKALRPEGINWPLHDDGSPSFKLEQLTQANGISHEQAHDAVSDVQATIAMARLIRERQPRLFDYAFALRSKHEVRRHLDIEGQSAHLHFSGKIPAIEHCMGVEVPLMVHPDRNNEVIVIDIRKDPSWVLQHSADELRQWLYSKNEDLPAGVSRPPLKTIHLNRSPMIAPLSLLDSDTEARLGLLKATLERHQQLVAGNPLFNRLALEVFTDTGDRHPPEDPEHALYSGFVDDHDRNLLNRMVHDKLKRIAWLDNCSLFHDDRLPPLVESVLARNFPDDLTDEQMAGWRIKRKQVLTSPTLGQAIQLPEALQKVADLLASDPDNPAYIDTQRYLQNFAQEWFEQENANTQDSVFSEDVNASTKTDESDSSAPFNGNDQLDLF